jgi:hypothetical protein
VAFLAALLLTTVAAAVPTPKTAITLSERVVEHDANWTPTSVYCERPRITGSKHRSTCQWVSQGNLLLPDEIVTVTDVYRSGGSYLYTLVATTYRPGGHPASCRIQAASRGGYRATCRRV